MFSDTSCNTASLDVYVPTVDNPWNVRKINHLYRRVAFGATKQEVIDALNQGNPAALVDSLIDNAVNLAPTEAPVWGFWNRDQFEAAEEADEEMDGGYFKRQGKITMITDMLQNKVRDRLTLFWSNHFVTEDKTYGSSAYQYQYYNLLQLHALGNLKEFTSDIGRCSAMLDYLNGNQNTKDRPNENYARELYELFTLGVDNGYTEEDVRETAKALTGYVDTNDIPWGPILFNADRFSNDNKTIFGQTGNWGYDDVITILFEQKQELIAKFICSKLYSYFVSFNCNEAIVNELATLLIAEDFNVAPVLRTLFKSEHFFNEEAIGTIIKSPADILLNYYNETGFTFSPEIDMTDFFIN